MFLLVWNINNGKYTQERYAGVIERKKHRTCHDFDWFCFEGPFLPLNKFISWSSTVSLKVLEISEATACVVDVLPNSTAEIQ